MPSAENRRAAARSVNRVQPTPRLSTLDRYILREFITGTVAAVIVLLVIFTGSTFADILSKVATGSLPAGVMFTVLGLHLVSTLQATLPVGMFLGMLMGLGRMYRDSEMHVLAASGFGPGGLLKPAAVCGIAVAVIVAIVALWLGPWAVRTSDREVRQASRSVIAAGLEAGRFTPLAGGGMLYAGSVSADGTRLRNLFVANQRTARNGTTRLSVTTAARGQLLHAGPGRGRYIALTDGHRYAIPLGRDDWRVVRFQRNDMALSRPTATGDDSDPQNTRTTRALLDDADPAARAELQWRIAIPFGALALAMLALPMARQGPRSSPAGRILIGVLAYLVIMNLMTLSRSWITGGDLPAPIGMWWILVPVFTGAAWTFARQYVARRPRKAGEVG